MNKSYPLKLQLLSLNREITNPDVLKNNKLKTKQTNNKIRLKYKITKETLLHQSQRIHSLFIKIIDTMKYKHYEYSSKS
jgi:hypothetical protein